MMRRVWTRLLETAQHDGRTKLIALVVALIVFQIIRTTISEKETFRVQVTAVRPPDSGYTVVNVEPSEVRVTLRGSLEQLRALREDALAVKVVTPAITSGEGHLEVSLRRSQVEGTGSARVDSLDPTHVRLEYEIEGTLRLSVARPVLVGTPLVGTAEVVWMETNVFVRGPMTQLRTLYDNAIPLATEKIDVDGRVQSFSKRVRILPPADIGKVTVTPPEIEVRVGIKVETETRVYENLPVLLTAVTGSGLVLASEPASVTVRVTGMSELLHQVQPEAISVVADSRNIGAQRGLEATYPLRVVLPSGSEGLSTEALPAVVRVKAQRVEMNRPTSVAPSPADPSTVRPDPGGP